MAAAAAAVLADVRMNESADCMQLAVIKKLFC